MGIFKPLPPRLQRGHPLARGLVGAWEFSEGSGPKAYDSSGTGNHGTLTGSAGIPIWAGGRAGSALTFNGSDRYVDIADSATLAPPNITVAAWLLPGNVSTYQMIAAKFKLETAVFHGWYLELFNDGHFDAAINTNFVVKSNGTIAIGIWVHLVFSYDGTTVVLYKNGALDKTSATTAGITNPAINMRIGQYTVGSEPLTGTVDSIRLYNRALSAAEVALMYQMTGP